MSGDYGNLFPYDREQEANCLNIEAMILVSH